MDVEGLAVWLEIDPGDAAVDLTRDGLGDACLDAAVEGMRASYRERSSPDGQAWAPLSAATVRQKGHAVIGVRSGVLLDPQRWRTAPRDISSRVAIWYYPSTGQKGDGCDGHARAFPAGHPLTGSPARPILGWTPAARETCRRLVSEAIRAAALDPTPPGPARPGRRPRPARRQGPPPPPAPGRSTPPAARPPPRVTRRQRPWRAPGRAATRGRGDRTPGSSSVPRRASWPCRDGSSTADRPAPTRTAGARRRAKRRARGPRRRQPRGARAEGPGRPRGSRPPRSAGFDSRAARGNLERRTPLGTPGRALAA
ncbi:MAG: hypothetical protein JO116_02690 [Planctomycetaceae bacterium]|nr:hypothetical protein [Planctomycetaceae bacterium]